MNTSDNHHQDGYHEGDSRSFFPVLAAWWQEIALGAVLLAVAGGAAILALQVFLPKYEASADVAVVQTGANVSLDERFKAVTPERRSTRDMRARRAALVGLVESGNIAIAVAQQIEWPEEDLEERTREARLLASVSGRLVTIGAVSRGNQSDLIRITCETRSPEMAVAIVNAWVEEYAKEVNRLYERVPQSVISTVRSELQEALRVYEKAQTDLEEFTASHEVVRLDSQIAINNENISNLNKIRQSAFGVLFNKVLESRILLLTRLYDERTELTGLLDAALALRTHIEAAGDAGLVSNGTAVQLLKFQIYTFNHAMPDNLELRFDHAGRTHTDLSAQKADVDAIISSLKYRIENIGQKVGELSGTLVDRFTEVGNFDDLSMRHMDISQLEEQGLDPALERSDNHIEETIFEISTQTQLLNSRKERLLSLRQSLEQARDLARSTIETLRNEVVELQLTAAAAPSVVRVASVAVLPDDSAWPSPVLVAVGAGALGFPIMTFLAFFANFLGIRPFLRKAGSGAPGGRAADS